MTELDNTGALAVLELLGLVYERNTTWEERVYALYALEQPLETRAEAVAPVR
jgi:hypothetical protein